MVLNERIRWPGLPRVDINTHTNTSSAPNFVSFEFSALDKVTKRNCSVTFSDQYGSAFFPSPVTYNCTIKGRGNYTWGRPKKPFNLSLTSATDFGTKLKVALFGMPSDSDWTILADYDDFTHMRDLVSSAIGFAFGQWASRMIQVELFLNGAYYGLCVFCEKVATGSNRINITKLAATDVASPAVTGGYVWEGGDPGYIPSTEKSFGTSQGETYGYKIPDGADVVDAQNTYSQATYNDFINRLYNVAFTDLTNGWQGAADITSMAKYFLIQDIIGNSDFNSFYLTKDRNAKIVGGPFWDAGTAFALRENAPWNVPENTTYGGVRPLYAKLLTDAAFVAALRTAFAAAFSLLNQIIADLRDFFPKLRGAPTRDGNNLDAIQRNAAAWPNTDWPGNFDRNAPLMLAFLTRRLYWQRRSLYFPLTPVGATLRTT